MLQVLAFHQQPEAKPVIQAGALQKRRDDGVRCDPRGSRADVLDIDRSGGAVLVHEADPVSDSGGCEQPGPSLSDGGSSGNRLPVRAFVARHPGKPTERLGPPNADLS